jgi:hypothetical protein
MPLVSVVTPSYNQAAYLEQAIASVLRQDGTEIEYCVVDGASQDGSQQVIQRVEGQLAWWVSEPDHGQAEAINKGFQRARGEVVAWLNSDDLYLPGAVRTALSVLLANPELGMVYGDAITIDANGRPLNRLSFRQWELSDLLGFRILCQPAVFMRRSVLERAGYLDPSYHFMLDHHLWIRMACLAPIQFIPQTLAAARQHAEAKNVKQAAGFSLETQRILDWMEAGGEGSSQAPQAQQADLAALLRSHRRHILGGAARLQARYYLDGEQPATALKYYSRAFWYDPIYASKHWHRMLYAIFTLVGARKLADRTLRPASGRRKQRSLSADLGCNQPLNILQSWPGLELSLLDQN